MTPRQRILAFLVAAERPPTVREIGRHVGLRSPSTVHAHLKRLERQGLVSRVNGWVAA